jgi:NADPH-dependent glutamate synthase beta subunit-like oxidoreductase
MTGVEFLHKVTENEHYTLSGDTVVIGGGNVAIDVSRTAVRCHSPKVYQVSLETRDIMPASKEEIELAESEGIEFKGGWGPKQILCEDGKVTGIVLKKCTSVNDADGRFNPQYDEDDTVTIKCSNVLLSVGQTIEWGGLLEGSKVELGRGNGAVADPVTYQTAEPDIFVGGDVYTGPKFAIDAIAAGKQGAISIHRFVQPHSSLTIGRDPNYFVELDKDDILVENYDNTPRQRPASRPGIGKDSFRDASIPLTEEQVKRETARCLGCGATIVDENQCIGCGVCTTKCEFDAIHLKRDIPEATTMIPSEDKLKYILPNGAKQAIRIKFAKK